MITENFTPAPWFCGIPFRNEGSLSEWCNIYADNEKNTIAEVLLHDGVNKNYYNAALIAAAPEMYDALKAIVGETRDGMQVVNVKKEVIEKAINALKKARGEK